MPKIDSHTRALLKNPQKRRAWVIYQVSLQGRSLATIAREAGVNRQTLYRVFDVRYPRMEKIVADAIGLPPSKLWPERYDSDGLPIRRRGRSRKSAVKTVDKTPTPRNGYRRPGD